MIVVDTSALMTIVLDEADAAPCIAVLEREHEVLVSAGTVAEAMIVAAARKVAAEMQAVISSLGFEVVPVTAASAARIAQAYVQWGRGMNSAGLNFGDCFAYELAKEHDCPLLFVGDDFSRTDIKRAL
ncbi:MAG TPA: type II toxin-antitoxin system VapC family toxin [Micropepsaceae bacterium]|nr:type II toxin-antitoxin system VapC family toxin [Micropepsaceae bacterium]